MAEPTSPTATHVPDADEILTGLRDALTGVLDATDLARINLDAIDADTPLLSLPIDSLALMDLMTRIEDRFRVYIPEERAYAFTTVGEVIDHVREKAAAKAARKRS
ncbi:acyl carrier protein [Micromonospora sp. NPDC048935]|uniref:acyl carrier protein n=1 Tax=Micromonospora sp. NPDC048935 TaxID=3364262 RepID=UPI0037209E70